MKILALETSCDETACAIVQDGRKVLANIIRSQADFHQQYGGVIPEFASRQHIEAVNYTVQEALSQADLSLESIDAIAATVGPGLVGALLIGATTAKTLSWAMQKPFLAVNHLYGHIAANYLDTDLSPPFLCLLVSGGHTQLVHIKAYDDIVCYGQTRDDAVGEAYDKIARVLGLGYPGGPKLDKLAQTGDPKRYTLPQGKTDTPWDFSFSGLKTATMRLIEKENALIDDAKKADIAAAFQATIAETLLKKTVKLAETLEVTTLSLAGGVAANSAIRAKLADIKHTHPEWTIVLPPLAYCTDNAAMIASSAFFNPISSDLGQEVFSRSPVPLGV